MTDSAQYLEWHPTLWWRFKHSERWPWTPRGVGHEDRVYGTQPWIAWIHANDIMVGWHPIDSPESTTVVIPGRWHCLAGIFRPMRIEVSITRDPDWDMKERAQEADDAVIRRFS